MTLRTLKETDAPSGPVVIAYTRVSSEEQSRGDGPARQIAYHDERAKSLGRGVDYDLRDIGLSAFSGEHLRVGQMGAIRRAVTEGRLPPASEIWVENLDRMSRQEPIDALGLLIEIMSAGLVVRTHMDGREYKRAGGGIEQSIGLVMATLTMGRGHDESVVKQDRISKAWTRKIARAREGEPLGTKATPGWIRLDADGYHVVEERAAVVRRIFDMLIAGHGKRSVAARLNAEGVPTFTRGQKTASIWGDSYVQKLLETRLVLGDYQPMRRVKGGSAKPHGEPIKGLYPAILDEETWHRARVAAASRRQRGGRPASAPTVFAGLLKCRCGVGMARVNKGLETRGRTLFVCRASTLAACDHDVRYDSAIVERLLAVQLRTDVDLIIDASGSQAAADRQRLQFLTARVVTLEGEREHLVSAIKRGLDVDAEYRALADDLATLRAERDRLASSTAVARADETSAAIHAVLAAIRSDDTDVRRRTAQRVRQVLDRVVFDGATIRLHYRDGPVSKMVSTGGYRHKPKPSSGQFVDGVRRRKDVVQTTSASDA